MTEEQIEKETESYGADLCAYCRECEGEKACQHKKDAMHGYKDGLKAGYHECEKEHEWHYDGTPDTTHKTCLVNVDYLPNIMLCFWNGEVWIEPRTLDRFKKVKAWKYVDFPKGD